ncbi:MAG: hypothetical protein LBU22_04645 [Dysgonamonadaceae bacterium]|jgi:hypothetical protein|nr:hypothetical protein [Dysgonamonadaceae bacterium]
MKFNTTKRDSQATEVEPVSPEKFDFEAYSAYEATLLKKTGAFWKADSGVAVYRRMRAAEVFADGSRDRKRSLELQLGCLEKGMAFKADIPNFLEPWYGIGVWASAYGIEYVWNEKQAPASHYRFETLAEALHYEPQAIAQTNIGKHTLEMIDYFMNRTKGKLPLCLTDSQSPFNTSTLIVNTSDMMLNILLDPDNVKTFLDNLAGLMIDFVAEQKKIIGDCLASPGHGFASARNFDGYGQSDDNIVMLSNDSYFECAVPSFEKVGMAYGGSALHSCGDWSNKLPLLNKIKKLQMVDAAFSPETDPNPNPALPFAEALANTGIVLNARIVGNLEVIEKTVSQLWRKGMKLIVVTYCPTPEEQEQAYKIIHEICV